MHLSLSGDSEAFELLLHKFYALELPPHHQKPWQTWNSLAHLAAALTEPEVHQQAAKNLEASVMCETEADQVYETIQVLNSAKFNKLGRLATALRKHHAAKILSNERYRADLDKHKALMWEHLDAFAAASLSLTEGTEGEESKSQGSCGS